MNSRSGVLPYVLMLAVLASGMVSLVHANMGATNGARQGLHEPDDAEYFIKKGDTLWSIAEDQLGSTWLWPKIWVMNPDIGHPDIIYVGERLTLYASLPDRIIQFDEIGWLPMSFDEPEPSDAEVVARDGAMPQISPPSKEEIMALHIELLRPSFIEPYIDPMLPPPLLTMYGVETELPPPPAMMTAALGN